MTKKWFSIGMTGVFFFSLTLRFWGLGRFNTLVFDEVYFATFGNNYLIHKPFFNAHPPLSQYIIGIGIWIGSHIPFWQEEVNGLAGSLLTPWSYRWINALTGSFIPLVVAAIAYQISYRRSFAFLAGLFTACDGIFLVESRYALNNIYIVIFGLLGQWFLLLALEKKNKKRIFLLVCSGIGFGASAATKWNGLSFLLGAYFIWITAWLIRWFQAFYLAKNKQQNLDELNVLDSPRDSNLKLNAVQTPLQKLTQLNLFQMVFFLGIIPAFIYSIIWIPHLQLDKRFNFITVHQQILKFHLQLGGNTPDVHPYCAAWYKWPLMTRPMAYYYQTTLSLNEPLPVMGPPLPPGTAKVIYDVHAMGNPFLWWFGLASLLFLVGIIVWQFINFWVKPKRFSAAPPFCIDSWIALFLVLNYLANLLPWVEVTRCAFIYHYMPAVVFTFLAIAWFVDQCIRSYHLYLRAVGVTITFIILIAFVFWMPIYLGLPLSPDAYKLRMWFDSWI